MLPAARPICPGTWLSTRVGCTAGTLTDSKIPKLKGSHVMGAAPILLCAEWAGCDGRRTEEVESMLEW